MNMEYVADIQGFIVPVRRTTETGIELLNGSKSLFFTYDQLKQTKEVGFPEQSKRGIR